MSGTKVDVVLDWGNLSDEILRLNRYLRGALYHRITYNAASQGHPLVIRELFIQDVTTRMDRYGTLHILFNHRNSGNDWFITAENFIDEELTQPLIELERNQIVITSRERVAVPGGKPALVARYNILFIVSRTPMAGRNPYSKKR